MARLRIFYVCFFCVCVFCVCGNRRKRRRWGGNVICIESVEGERCVDRKEGEGKGKERTGQGGE